MDSIKDEKIIMTSNDNSITLTTHRVFQRTETINKEILLKNITSHEIVKKKMNYYMILTAIFLLLTLYLFIEIQSNYNNTLEGLFWFCLIITCISAIFLFSAFKKILRISSYFGVIEFSLSDIKAESLNDFLNKMYTYAELRKKEN